VVDSGSVDIDGIVRIADPIEAPILSHADTTFGGRTTVHEPARFGTIDRDVSVEAGVRLRQGDLRIDEGSIRPPYDLHAIAWPTNPFGGGGDEAWMSYVPNFADGRTLQIGIANDANDDIRLTQGGQVAMQIQSGAMTVHTDLVVEGDIP